MQIIHDPKQGQQFCQQITGSIGFVATMGNLHQGHLSLLQRSRAENDYTVLSLFVNPTQFNDPSDLENYPRTLEEDLALAKAQGVDMVFVPDNAAMYPDNYRYQVVEQDLARLMEGKSRPGHFNGMLTIVLKLLLLVQPTRAYFGAKDYQQYQLISDMADALFLTCDIIVCDTVREADGLAMSSRNSRLTASQRELAPMLHQCLCQPLPLAEIQQQLQELGFAVEYLQQHQGRRYVAAKLGTVRLIDNIASTE